jgi:hypothetical protein
METKHTPGPWAIQEMKTGHFRITSTCRIEWDIATVDRDVNSFRAKTDDKGVSFESIANAHLIAACPEMFEVIK